MIYRDLNFDKFETLTVKDRKKEKTLLVRETQLWILFLTLASKDIQQINYLVTSWYLHLFNKS